MINYRSKNRRITPWTVAWAFILLLSAVPLLLFCGVVDIVCWLFGIDEDEDG